MKTIHLVAALSLAFAGCMHAQTGTSSELVAARTAFARAAQGPARTDAPQALVEARRSLDAAEHAHQLDPTSARERHLATIARQRADLAIEKANTVAAERDAALRKDELARNAGEAAQAADAAAAQAQREATARATAEQNAIAARTDLQRLEQELADTRKALLDAGTASDDATAALRQREVALQAQVERLRSERDTSEQARLEAERQKTQAQNERDQAIASLQALGSLQRNASGDLVLTLPSEVLFRSGSATLRTNAMEKLDEIAHALAKLGKDQQFEIEGHTDSRGSSRYNERLSRRRANAVRRYLIEQGVDSDRIAARGRGEDDPVASNRDAEGRAENRRVEIVVTPSTVSTR
jgi:outer membrane protein OmpA-like peptidoglycan-associated protein